MSQFGRFNITAPVRQGVLNRDIPILPANNSNISTFPSRMMASNSSIQKTNAVPGSSPTGSPTTLVRFSPPTTPTKSSSTNVNSSNETTNDPNAFLVELNAAKKKLKTKSGFEQAATDIGLLMKDHLSPTQKQQFYGAMSSLSFLAGKPGYDVKVIKKVYDIALSDKCITSWSSGYLNNIKQWHSIVSKMIDGTWESSSYGKDDGRFGTTRSTDSPRVIVPSVRSNQFHGGISVNNLFSLLVGNNPFAGRMFRDTSSDDSSEEDEEAKPYPFLQFANEPPLMDFKQVKHSPEPITCRYEFKVSDDIIQRLSEENIAIHLICSNSMGFNNSGVKSPEYIRYKVNDKVVSLVGAGKELQYGYNISSLCISGLNYLSITTLQCCCNLKFGIKLVKPTMKTLLEDISSRTLTKNESLEKIKESFANQGDIVELHITLSLMCPLGQMFIETPVRGKNCKHVQCFDLETYLLMNKAQPNWECPVCSKKTLTDDLIVDEYMKEILNIVGDDEVAESIKMDENGKWELFKIEFGDHSSDSEDENIIDGTSLLKKRSRSTAELPQTAPPTKVMRTLTPKPSKIIIDLTL